MIERVKKKEKEKEIKTNVTFLPITSFIFLNVLYINNKKK